MTVLQHDAGRMSRIADQRGAYRADVCLGAILFSEHGRVTGLVVNLSRTGMCVESDKALADLLLASVRCTSGGVPVVVRACLEVPAGEAGTAPVTVQARAVYVIHDRADVYRCGLEFRVFTEGKEALDGYLRDCGVED